MGDYGYQCQKRLAHGYIKLWKPARLLFLWVINVTNAGKQENMDKYHQISHKLTVQNLPATSLH